MTLMYHVLYLSQESTNRNYQLRFNILLPVLSAQLMTAPTGKAKDILNFAPAEPPRPKINEKI